MENRFKIIETVIENNSDVVMMEEDSYPNLFIAYTNYSQAKLSFISDLMHRMAHMENEHVQYTIKLVDHIAGLVIESFSLKFNQNFNLPKDEKLH